MRMNRDQNSHRIGCTIYEFECRENPNKHFNVCTQYIKNGYPSGRRGSSACMSPFTPIREGGKLVCGSGSKTLA